MEMPLTGDANKAPTSVYMASARGRGAGAGAEASHGARGELRTSPFLCHGRAARGRSLLPFAGRAGAAQAVLRSTEEVFQL